MKLGFDKSGGKSIAFIIKSCILIIYNNYLESNIPLLKGEYNLIFSYFFIIDFVFKDVILFGERWRFYA